MKLTPLACHQPPLLAFAAHIGVGHANSHQGFVQDDATGFATLLALLLRACPLNPSVTDIRTEDASLTVRLACGVQGTATLSQGFSPFETDLLRRASGLCELSSQSLTTRVLGRVRGQGMDRLGAVLTLAHARALLEALRRYWPAETRYTEDDVPGSCGAFLGGMLSLEGLPCAWLLTINASPDGSGPVEDSEGIVPVGGKGELMGKLGMDRVPCIVLESKACSPGNSDGLTGSTPWVRWNRDSDNPVVGRCLAEAARQYHAQAVISDTAYPRRPSDLDDAGRALGEKIARLGHEYAAARTSAHKVALASTLARLLEQEIGGTSFMSPSIHSLAGGGGLWPGQGAMLSLLASRTEYRQRKTIITEQPELDLLVDIALKAARLLGQRLPEAQVFLRERRPRTTPEQLLERLTADHGASASVTTEAPRH